MGSPSSFSKQEVKAPELTQEQLDQFEEERQEMVSEMEEGLKRLTAKFGADHITVKNVKTFYDGLACMSIKDYAELNIVMEEIEEEKLIEELNQMDKGL